MVARQAKAFYLAIRRGDGARGAVEPINALALSDVRFPNRVSTKRCGSDAIANHHSTFATR
jgi:hypothetical protein